MRWNGKNLRPAGYQKQSINPAPIRTGALDTSKAKLVASYFAGPLSGGEAPIPPVEVNIAPSSAVQFENVVLTASTTGTSPTFIWTLTNFYDTTDTQVSSYTGATLVEGYFTTAADNNVSVSMTCDEGAGSTSTFSVTAFDPVSLSPDLWYDMSDATTMTLRVGTDYIEQINDKSGNDVHLTQTTATYQPLYAASSVNVSLSAATFDGIDNWIQNNSNPQVSAISGQTTFAVGQVKDKSGLPGVGTGNQLDGDFYNLFGGTTNISYRRHLQRAGGGTNWLHNYYYQTQRYQLVSSVDGGNDKIISFRRENATTIDDATINGVELTISSTSQARNYDGGSIRIGTMNDLTNNYAQKLYGEMGEFIHFHRTITDAEKELLNRYLQIKWFGSMTY